MPTLGELVEIKGGGTPSRKIPAYWNGGIPWATVKDFNSISLKSTIENISSDGLDNSATNFMEAGMIIIPTRMAVGKAAINSIGMAINQDLKALQIKDSNKVDRDYLFRTILNNSEYLENRSNGATVKGITLDVLKGMEIPLPPLEEQKRIAAILDKADALRRKRQQAIDLTDQLLRSVFLDMFGDPVTNPNGWDEVPLAKLCSVPLQNGAYYPNEAYTNNGNSGTCMIHMSDAFYGFAKVETAKRVEIPEKDIKKYGLQKNDLLVARRSLTLEGSAKPCRIPNLLEPVIYESSLIRIRPNLSKILPEYLYYFLSDIRARQKYINKFVTSSTISGINQSNLAKVLVLVPDIDKQKKLVDFIKKCESKIVNQKESELYIDSLLSSITQRAFRGELTKQTEMA